MSTPKKVQNQSCCIKQEIARRMPCWACLKNGQHLTQKKCYAIPFQKLVFYSLYPDFLEKKQRNKKKVDFLLILAVFVSSTMLV